MPVSVRLVDFLQKSAGTNGGGEEVQGRPHRDPGGMLGTHHQTVTLNRAELRHSGLMDRGWKRIKVFDRAGLKIIGGGVW
jgi:hypothetical protein